MFWFIEQFLKGCANVLYYPLFLQCVLMFQLAKRDQDENSGRSAAGRCCVLCPMWQAPATVSGCRKGNFYLSSSLPCAQTPPNTQEASFPTPFLSQCTISIYWCKIQQVTQVHCYGKCARLLSVWYHYSANGSLDVLSDKITIILSSVVSVQIRNN